ncbi:MAG: PAS domain-containing protein, partial [Solirubrobacterales bacterium]|nr:PAS domain-containing protein [Solirubrobacterales bacterium]
MIVSEFDAALAGQAEQFTLSYRILHADGAVRDLDTRAHVERDAGGAIFRMTGVTRDVTEIRAVESARKRAERALRDREQMLSGVIDKIPGPAGGARPQLRLNADSPRRRPVSK